MLQNLYTYKKKFRLLGYKAHSYQKYFYILYFFMYYLF